MLIVCAMYAKFGCPEVHEIRSCSGKWDASDTGKTSHSADCKTNFIFEMMSSFRGQVGLTYYNGYSSNGFLSLRSYVLGDGYRGYYMVSRDPPSEIQMVLENYSEINNIFYGGTLGNFRFPARDKSDDDEFRLQGKGDT
jgi:hypothetical protein